VTEDVPPTSAGGPDASEPRRADAVRSRERILAAAGRLLGQSPGATVGDIAAAAGTSRTTVYRHFGDRDGVVAAVSERRRSPRPAAGAGHLPAGRLGRTGPVVLDAIHVMDAVPPAQLPGQLVAEAARIARVPVALYVLDIDGTYLLRVAGPRRLPDLLEAPLAVGPELDAEALQRLHAHLQTHPEPTHVVPLWLRGRAIGVMISFGRPAQPLDDMARQAAAAITLADRYTDVFAQAQRRKRPVAAAEIQQSLLPPRISQVTGGEVAGNVLPSYEVAGDWFDIVENPDGLWITIADGLGGTTRAAASSAVALGALRASRRSGADVPEALIAMHQTLREMPGPHMEMTALGVHWNASTAVLRMVDCGHVPPVILRADGAVERVRFAGGRGLGGRAGPAPSQVVSSLGPGDRLVMVSDGIVRSGPDQVGLGMDAVVTAARRSRDRSASSTVRHIHAAVLRASPDGLDDDATAVCLAVAPEPAGA
jgi:serine phosphatase RsbU (regulator of sigma subunit)